MTVPTSQILAVRVKKPFADGVDQPDPGDARQKAVC
jgi:hypothetical protein